MAEGISRNEQILNNMLSQSGTEGLPTPISRIGQTLYELAELMGCGIMIQPESGDAGKVPTVGSDLKYALTTPTYIGSVTVSGKKLIIT